MQYNVMLIYRFMQTDHGLTDRHVIQIYGHPHGTA